MKSKYLRGLSSLTPKEETYFFRDAVEDERRIGSNGQKVSSKDYLGRLKVRHSAFQELPDIYTRNLIIAAPFYDENAGRTRRLIYMLNEGQDFSDPSFDGIQRMSTEEKAKIAAKEFVHDLRKSGVNYLIGPEVTIVSFPSYGYEVQVSMVFEATKSQLKTIDSVISKKWIGPEELSKRLEKPGIH